MAQSTFTPAGSAAEGPQAPAAETQSPFVGSWSYRSFISDPNLSTSPDKLSFGRGTFALSVPTPDHLIGTLDGDGWQLNLKGGVSGGNPATVHFQGKGIIGGEEWIYDYLGYLVPVWQNGDNQRPAIVGTIVRAKPHSDVKGGIAPAGVVAQWIAVKQDSRAGLVEARSNQRTVLGRNTQSATGYGAAPSGKAADDKAEAVRRLREMYARQDVIDRLREELRRHRTAGPERNSALKGRSLGGGLGAGGADVGSYRTNFQPRSSLNPLTHSSANGRLDLTLDVNYGVFTIGKDQVRLRTYNNRLVGPALRLKAGDTLYITLVNNLPPNTDDSQSHDMNDYREWNTTNLHFHGLHVRPQALKKGEPESDNVLLELPPSSPFDPKISIQKYAVHIPSDHVAGTFWYHAHRHGSTAAQVSSGLAGALIIDREDNVTNLDSIPEIKAAAQEIVVLQQIPYTFKAFGTLGGIENTSRDDSNNMFGPGQWATLKRYTLVNGDRIPTITLAPGEVRRFRFIHAGQHEEIVLKIEGASGSADAGSKLTFHEIALDGLPTGKLGESTDEITLYPGYRSDALLQASVNASGEYYLVDENLAKNDKGADGSPEPIRWIAKIVVTGGPPVRMALPGTDKLISHRLKDIPPGDVSGTRYAFYGIDFHTDKPDGPLNFLISWDDLSATLKAVDLQNGSTFSPNPSRVRHLPLGKTERWLVGTRNGADPKDGKPYILPHPFHIHINPFLVTKVTAIQDDGKVVDVTKEEIGGPTSRDTLSMKHGYTYELLTKYEDFAGSFVEHCHILQHEDLGMMEQVTVDDPTATANAAATGAGVERNRTSAFVPESKGKPSVLLFVRGAYCQHCMTQLTEMATKLFEPKSLGFGDQCLERGGLARFPTSPLHIGGRSETRDLPEIRRP